MNIILGLILGFLFFLDIIQYVIFLDIILSWASLIGLRIRPRFVGYILDPIYQIIRKAIPTQTGPFDFTPMIVILACILIRGAIFTMFPDLLSYAGF